MRASIKGRLAPYLKGLKMLGRHLPVCKSCLLLQNGGRIFQVYPLTSIYDLFSENRTWYLFNSVSLWRKKKHKHKKKNKKKTQQMAPYFLCKPTFTIVWANSADDNLMIFFLFFSVNRDLTFHTNCLQWRQSAWNVKSLFQEKKIRKIFQNAVS